MDFLSGAKISVLWASSAAAVGTTGDASGTTAGTTAFGGSTAGGYPYASTGLDMAGYRSLMLLATVAGATAAILKAGFSTVGSSAAVTGWTDLNNAGSGATSTSPSTTWTLLSLDLANPAPRYLAGIVQIPTSSAIVKSIVGVQYNPTTRPVTQPTNNAGTNIVYGTTA